MQMLCLLMGQSGRMMKCQEHGINNKKASEMGHLDQSSKGGIMETLKLTPKA